MTDKIYNWTDDPMISGVADCNTDVVNDCLMHLKYENTSDAIQNMYETGQVEKQTRAFNQLLSMKHSTFDKSKFTIVGNPTITDEGIASGFSRAAAHLAIPLNLTSNSLFSLEIEIDTTSSTGEGNGWLINDPTNTTNLCIWIDAKYKNFSFHFAGTSIRSVNTAYNSKYRIYFQRNNTTMFYIKIVDIISNTVLVDEKVTKSIDTSFTLSKLLVGNTTSQININLKSFSITVDGKEVFNGNKTGVDTIKSDNYEVVGSPVISDDGIVSGFSSSNYLKTTSFSFSNYWKFNCKFNIKNIPDTLFPFLQLSSFNRILLQNSGNIRIFADENNNTGHFVDLFGINTIQTNTNYDLEISYNNNLYNGKLTNLDNNSIVTSTVTSMYYFPTDSSNWNIGSDGSRYIDGSIDLNFFKIYVDNNLVYQPCLKIPYTQSKTGSKIVNVAYRDRVQDLYEQTGTASYYTIDETNQNFTLPMGEIYGMIERKSKQNNIPIGQPIIRLDNTLYSNEVRLEGAAVSKTTYSNVYEVYGDTYAIEQPADDKFYLPDFRNRAIWGSNGFGYLSAGLPNITGKTNISVNELVEGAFNIISPASNVYTFTNKGRGNNMDFDASRSSSIYGGSSTVQPPAIKVRVVTKFKDEDYPTLVES